MKLKGNRESSFAPGRLRARRWGLAGCLVGGLVGTVAFAPANWLAQAVAAATNQKVLLTEAHGSIWKGASQVVLSSGAGSRDATSLSSPVHWTLGLQGLGLKLALTQDCCIKGDLNLVLRPSITGLSIHWAAGAGSQIEWPATLLSGLGAPFNTLQLGGKVRLSSTGASFELGREGTQFRGSIEADLLQASSRLAPLPTLGSYRLRLTGQVAAGTELKLQTLDGPLQLSGQGNWRSTGLQFKGEARASEAQAPLLNNLLNLFGRREGDRAVISIG